MHVELQQLRQAIALADHGSFVRAAAALHISQPALSRSIQNLESRFGNTLFVRATSGVVPTDFGRVCLERARDLLRMADELESEAVGHGALRRGRVAVGGGPFPAESFLGPAAARLIDAYPQAVVEVRTHNWDELLRQLRSRELDFFVAETSTLAREADLEVEALPSRHSIHFFVRAGHPLAGRRGVTAGEVMHWPFAAPSRVPPRMLKPLLRAQGAPSARSSTLRPFPAIECNGVASVKRIVRDSNAVSASILSCISSELETGEFVLVGSEPELHLQYGIVRLRRRPWTQIALALHGHVLDAEREASAEEARLLARFAARKSARRRSAITRGRRTTSTVR